MFINQHHTLVREVDKLGKMPDKGFSHNNRKAVKFDSLKKEKNKIYSAALQIVLRFISRQFDFVPTCLCRRLQEGMNLEIHPSFLQQIRFGADSFSLMKRKCCR